MTYREIMEYLEQMNRLGSVPGLDSIRRLCDRLGNPQEKTAFVHIAGTNGKGSTLAMISQVLTKAGKRTGRYVSPAVMDYREHFQIDGKMISKAEYSKYMTRVIEEADAMEAEGLSHPTVFEMETALAFLFFAEKKCDLAVLETGMGGALDATNLIEKPLVCVITSISMDHMQFLGDTLSKIAEQKAGIIKRGCPVVTGIGQDAEVLSVIRRKAQLMDSELTVADEGALTGVKYGMTTQSFHYKSRKNLKIHMAGVWQIENAVLALEALDVLAGQGIAISEEAIRAGLEETCWQGRLSVIFRKPLFVVDGAHNPDAAKKLAKSMEQYFPDKKRIFIMGILRDKAVEEIVRTLSPLANQVITVTTPQNARSLSAYELAMTVKEFQPNVTSADSLEEAVEMALLMADDKTLVAAMGSLSFLGRITEIVTNRVKG